MIKSIDFKEKTQVIAKQNPSVSDSCWMVAIDLGFGAVKGFSENKIFSFPNFARKVENFTNLIGTPADNDIYYRDAKGTVWAIGETAQALITTGESSESSEVLYGRNRYPSAQFKALADAALGIGMKENEFGNANGKTIILQTGLPPRYIKEDSSSLRESLEGKHSFDLKIGQDKWKHYEFDLSGGNIKIMPQPLGSLYSAIIDKKGNWSADASHILDLKVQVWDGGFKTFDKYSIRNHVPEGNGETIDDLGMKQVFQRTADKILKTYNKDIQVYAMQTLLDDGEFKSYDPKTRSSTKISFVDILEESNKEVCMEMIDRLDIMNNHFLDIDCIIVTGGTGAAWWDIISNELSGMEGLKIISANKNDEDLPSIFSNVRGYYMFLFKNMEKTLKGKSV